VTYDYGTSNGINDAISRVDAVKDGATALAQYSYLGGSAFVITDYTEPDINWTLADLAGSNDPDTGDIYSGFDRFGRVKDNRWYNYGTSSDTDRIKYGYDRNGNRTYRENTVATANSAKFDELYQKDLLDRLKHMDRGQLSTLKDSITNKTFAQCWSLDPTGNWKKFLEDDNGDGTWSLNQTRTANKVNEISDITETTGPSWITPAYNRAGNMTTMPKVADPTVSQTNTYDAWNRLTKVAEGATTISEYAYDAAKRRIVQSSTFLSSLVTRHFYYTEPSKWQVIEERLGTTPDSANAERQFVWGLRYIDDLILRDRDTDANGTLNERLYTLQDANWNVTAITNASGTVQERYNYAAYGMPTFLTSTFGSRASSSFDWETLYCGYRWEELVGVFHVRNRVLHSNLGAWIQRDPLGLTAGINLLQYLDSMPSATTDPTGLLPLLIWITIWIGVLIFVAAIGRWCAMRYARRTQVLTGPKEDCFGEGFPASQKVRDALALIDGCMGGGSDQIRNKINDGTIKCNNEPYVGGGGPATFLGQATILTDCTSLSAADVAMELLGELWRLPGKNRISSGGLTLAQHDAELARLMNCLCAGNNRPTRPWGHTEDGGQTHRCP
jgi:RHS repeat-associated protein